MSVNYRLNVLLQGLADVLEENSARVGRLLKLGAELQTAGCRGAGAVSRKLDARWKTLTKRVDREQHALIKHSKLRSRSQITHELI